MARLIFGHVVNHRSPKGTRFILKAIDSLRSQGHDFGFLFGECVPHKTAMEMYTHIDVLLEQFVLGWYGLQAVECMAMGKIVIAHINSHYTDCVPQELLRDLPIISANATELESVLRHILTLSDDVILRLGESGKEFVHKWHDAETIAKQLVKDYVKEN